VDRQKLEAIFERQLPNGTFVHEDEKVRNLLPALFLISGSKLSDIKTDDMRALISEFARKMKLPEGYSEDEFTRALTAYYKENPPDPQLLRELQEACG
jgi:hypothetical protein